jgi:hypothetical protein
MIAIYAAAAPTLQCAPSESTNCASTPPKSCFFGGMLNSTPLPHHIPIESLDIGNCETQLDFSR